MERIELFDKYISNQLSDSEKADFEARLNSDEKFASDFKVYLLTVDGICKEAKQDNLDFGIAMKSISKAQLQEIIGKREESERTVASSQPTVATKPRVIRFKTWIWQAASIAAVVVIAFTVVLKVEQNSRNNVYDTIYACADINYDLVRSGGKKIDITTLSDDELKAKLPELVSIYNSSHSDDEVADNGTALAMSYIRFHDADKAKEVLNGLISQFKDNEEYAEDVKKWETILNLLK